MKKMRSAILALFMMVGVNASYSQFYDVKIVKKPRVVSTRSESGPLFSKKIGQPLKKDGHCPGKMDTYVLRETDVPGHERVSASVDSPALGRKVSVSDSIAGGEMGTVSSDSIRLSADVPLFCAPLDTLIISSPYGYRKDPFSGKRKFHAGTDYVTSSENVYAMMPGRIHKIGYDKKLGNFITLDHGDIRVTYAHLHTVVGRKGDSVFAGQSVGISGNTGRSTGEHLHVAIRYKKEVVDPAPLVKLISEYAVQYSEDMRKKVQEMVMKE